MTSDPYTKPKRIHVFVNGFPTERIFFIHPKCRLSWFSIINTIGELLKPESGAVRVLRRVDGRAVYAYEELEENGKYVACGREPLIFLDGGYHQSRSKLCRMVRKRWEPLDTISLRFIPKQDTACAGTLIHIVYSTYYRTESEIVLQKDFQKTSSTNLVNSSGSNVRYLADRKEMAIITIYVFVNGLKTKPFKISLLDADLCNWTNVFNIISKQLNEPIKYLYTVFGARLKCPSEIEHKGFYVALPEGSCFKDVSYISVFSPKRQRKVRFKQTTQQTTSVEETVLSKDMSAPNEAEGKEDMIKPIEELSEFIPSSQEQTELVRSCQVIHLNEPSSETPCIHVSIVQKLTKHFPGVPADACATKPTATLIFEMIAEHEHNAVCHLCKGTQTNTIFCEAFPKGKFMIEVGSRKFHIIADEDAIVLPCGTYFSSHRSMKKPCTLPLGNEFLSFENIANHIVGIVLDTSEYCITRAIYGLEQPIFYQGDRASEGIEKKDSKTANNILPEELNSPTDDISSQMQPEVAT